MMSSSYSQHTELQELCLSRCPLPATEALNQQLVAKDVNKRQRNDDSPYQQIAMTALNKSLNSAFDDLGFPEIVEEDLCFPERADSQCLASSRELTAYATVACHQKCRGVVRSRTIPSRMWLMDGESLAAVR